MSPSDQTVNIDPTLFTWRIIKSWHESKTKVPHRDPKTGLMKERETIVRYPLYTLAQIPYGEDGKPDLSRTVTRPGYFRTWTQAFNERLRLSGVQDRRAKALSKLAYMRRRAVIKAIGGRAQGAAT